MQADSAYGSCSLHYAAFKTGEACQGRIRAADATPVKAVLFVPRFRRRMLPACVIMMAPSSCGGSFVRGPSPALHTRRVSTDLPSQQASPPRVVLSTANRDICSEWTEKRSSRHDARPSSPRAAGEPGQRLGRGHQLSCALRRLVVLVLILVPHATNRHDPPRMAGSAQHTRPALIDQWQHALPAKQRTDFTCRTCTVTTRQMHRDPTLH